MSGKKRGRKPSGKATKKRKYAKRRKGGLSGFGLGSQVQKQASQLGKPLAMIAGLVAGNFIAAQLDKVAALTPADPNNPGVKQYIKPAILIIVGGVTGAAMKNDIAKFFGFGVAGSGILVLANKITKKDLVENLKGADVYTENAEDIKRMLAENGKRFTPELPQFRGDENQYPVSSMAGSDFEEAQIL